jgi:tRNA(Ile)-lysidine synthase
MTKIMREEFLNHIRNNNLFTPEERVLLSVSGGIDSMVMTELFLQEGFKISVAHVNHKLREQASDEDADFVRSFCLSRGITFHSKELDPSELQSGNVQSNARNARYDFLEEIANHFGYDKIATAHNQDDTLETFLMNIIRGTGLNGLSGIPVKRGKIVRPLLFASRSRIETYAKKNTVLYREDASNDSLKYLRNKIRHQVLPTIKGIDTRMGKGILKTIENLNQDTMLLNFLIRERTSDWKTTTDNYTKIDMETLSESVYAPSLLRHLLLEFGFNSDQATEIIEQKSNSGLLFYSSSHVLLIDRGQILIKPIQMVDEYNSPVSIDELPCHIIFQEKIITLEIIDYYPELDLSGPDQFIDYEKVSFPILLRTWQQGDSFQPLGMKGSQKVQDFLVNLKVDRFSKPNTLILLDQSTILGLPQYRISEKVKISKSTQKVIRIRLE